MKNRRDDLLGLALSLGIVLAGALILSYYFFKIDLTEEKRHTLTPSTISMLEGLDDQIFVRVYLHGKFPAGFKRLERSIRERLDEFKDYSGDLVNYEFIDPYESGDKKTIKENEQALYEKGLKFTTLDYEENGVRQSTNIWPGAIIEYKGQEYPVQFFKSDLPEPSGEMINSSVNSLEYELASSFRRALRREDKPIVAFSQGHGELHPLEVYSFGKALEEDYGIEFVELKGKLNALTDFVSKNAGRKIKYDLLVVAKPDSAFGDQDRAVLDQYIMNGGKVLWLVDPVLTDLDSLRQQQQTIALSNEMGLYEMLFEYGARINRDMLIDFQAAPIVFDAGPMGNQRNMQVYSWYYAPLIFNPEKPHPIAANLDPIKFEFASTIDTVNPSPLVHKVPLLYSSELSKVLKTPVRVNTGIVQFGIDYFKQNPQPHRIMALLMEGQFKSAIDDQLPEMWRQDTVFAYKSLSKPTSMIVVADGDIIRNAVSNSKEGPMPLPLGFDRYSRRVIYDNQDFLMNCVNYLLNDAGIIAVRSRSIELRKLDSQKITNSKGLIQTANASLPIIIVGLAGIILTQTRKKRWIRK
jgi:gliding-associated putative ABC transporter substrate-binding component GldG